MPDLKHVSDDNYLEPLHAGNIARVDFISCMQPVNSSDAGWSERFHIVVPHAGSFLYREGRSATFLDVSAAIFVNANREYRVSHPVEGDASLAIFPRRNVLDELTSLLDHRTDSKRRLRSAASQLAIRRLRHALRHRTDELEVDEALIGLVASFSREKASLLNASPHAQSIVNRAQEYILGEYHEPLTIDQIAVAVGVSSVHLAQLFRKVTGSSLHRYIMNLRLAEALTRVEESGDFTALAFDLGFSSHSHFTAAFRQRYGRAPSAFRDHSPSGAFRAGNPAARVRQPLCWSRCAA